METAYTPFVLPKSTTHNLPSTMTNLANHTGSGPSSSPAEHAAWQGVVLNVRQIKGLTLRGTVRSGQGNQDVQAAGCCLGCVQL